ncbi:MAG: sigma-54 dependent transcriptional regulator [Acidobacteriota bacterium]
MDTNTRRDSLDYRTATSTTGSQDAPSGTVDLRVPGLVIVAHPDPTRVGEEVPLPELIEGQATEISRRAPRFLPPAAEATPRALAENHLSRRPVRLIPGPEAGQITLDRAGSPTALHVDGQEIDGRRTFTAAEIERGVVVVLARRVALLLQPISALPAASVVGPSFGLVGHSAAIVRLRREIRAAALLDVPVLIRGETGTGKELVARAIHDAGERSDGPYLALNLGALVPALAASELFGATRGAYTGADRQREGFFRRAHRGTLFLDEIGESPVEVQVMLLRTLETGRVQPVGGVDERAVDVRVITATDADLESALDEGRFRPALLHRLAGYEIRVPSLRERRDDIARLLVHFLNLEAEALGANASETAWPPASAIDRLIAYHWPGNVRELKNVARRLAVLRHIEGVTDPGPLLDDLLRVTASSTPSRTQTADDEPGSSPAWKRRRGADIDDDELLAALEAHGWRPGPAAAALGLSRPALYRRIDEHPDLRKASEIDADDVRAALAEHGTVQRAARALKVSPQGLKRHLTALGIVSV